MNLPWDEAEVYGFGDGMYYTEYIVTTAVVVKISLLESSEGSARANALQALSETLIADDDDVMSVEHVSILSVENTGRTIEEVIREEK